MTDPHSLYLKVKQVFVKRKKISRSFSIVHYWKWLPNFLPARISSEWVVYENQYVLFNHFRNLFYATRFILFINDSNYVDKRVSEYLDNFV